MTVNGHPAPASERVHRARPLVVSGAMSVFAGLLAVLLIANSRSQIIALAIAVVGLLGVSVGLEVYHREYPLVGTIVILLGIAGGLVALGWGAALVRQLSSKLELLPGIVGLFVLVAGLGSVKPGYERWFVGAGTGGLLLGVFVSGFTHGAPAMALLLATVATVVAWDVGEQAINMGEQVGRGGRTWPVEVTHGSVGALVGLLGVAVAVVMGVANVRGLPLIGLAALLVAAVVLAISLET